MNTLQFLLVNQWLTKVRDYIKNQEEHHKKGTFVEEYEEFMRKFNFKSHG